MMAQMDKLVQDWDPKTSVEFTTDNDQEKK